MVIAVPIGSEGKIFTYLMGREGSNVLNEFMFRWLISKETFIAYVRPKDGRLHCVMLVDPEFEAASRGYEEGATNGVIVSNLSRYVIQIPTIFSC